jgi:hypothetical protein
LAVALPAVFHCARPADCPMDERGNNRRLRKHAPLECDHSFASASPAVQTAAGAESAIAATAIHKKLGSK